MAAAVIHSNVLFLREIRLLTITFYILAITAAASTDNATTTFTPVTKGSREAKTEGARGAYAELIQHLLANANPRIPPNADDLAQPVDVSMDVSFPTVEHLDTREQVLTVYLALYLHWFDKALSWNTTIHPVDAVYLKAQEVWRPELVAISTAEASDLLMKQEVMLKVESDGRVHWVVSSRINRHCALDIQLFPFDEQECVISIGSLTTTSREVRINLGSVKKPYDKNPEWILTGIRQALYGKTVWIASFSLQLKRRWTVHALNVLLPVVLVSGLNCLVFLLPVESGEKMSVSVTTFLTLAVFMTLVQDSLPSNSETVCYLAVYLATQICISVLGVVLSAVVVKCHHGNSGDALAAEASSETSSTFSYSNGVMAEKINGVADLPTVSGPSDVYLDGLGTTNGLIEKEREAGARNWGVDWPSVGRRIDCVSFPLFAFLSIATVTPYLLMVTQFRPEEETFTRF